MVWETKQAEKSETSQDLSAGALSLTLTPSRDAFVHLAAIHFSGNVSQTVTVKLTSPTGANYVFEIKSTTLSSADDFVYEPNKPLLVPSGWTLTLASTNSGTPAITAYASIVYQGR